MPLPEVGLLLINLGTPAQPNVEDVRKYLREFLSDPLVITLPAPLRWLLVNCIILPRRSSKTAHAYQTIWQQDGSPLLKNSLQFCAALAERYPVALGMRYGEPSIAAALAELKYCKKIMVLPLFPQYSTAATGSAIAQVQKIIAQQYPQIETIIIRDFYHVPGYIEAMAATIKPHLEDYDYLLTSYHGLPVRQAGNYSQDCHLTTRMLAAKLDLPEHKWGLSFQSRLGWLPWLQPYTDDKLVQLRESGVRKLIVCCPSFVADCLETLEEIGIRAQHRWLSLGGERFTLVPCLNGRSDWIEDLITSV